MLVDVALVPGDRLGSGSVVSNGSGEGGGEDWGRSGSEVLGVGKDWEVSLVGKGGVGWGIEKDMGMNACWTEQEGWTVCAV